MRRPRKWTADNTRIFLERFYAKHNPEKLATMDLILDRYRGHEGELFEHLKEKYDVSGFFAEEGGEGGEEDEDEEDEDDDEEEDDEDDEGGEDDEGDSGGGRDSAEGRDSNSVRDPNGTTSASMVQDLSNRLLGWQKASGVAAAPPKQALTPQSHHMQQRAAAAAAASSSSSSSAAAAASAQFDAERAQLLGQINMLKSQVVGLKKEHEMVQRNLVAVVDKETKLGRESASLQEQIKAAERARQELAQQLQVVQRQRDAKHQQLEETVQLNHRLGGQVRFLAAKAFETMDQGPAGAGSANKKSGDSLLRLPEFGAFEKKVEQAVSEVCAAELKKRASAGEGQQGAVETDADGAVAAAAKRDTLPAALQRSLEVVYSCFLASRVELRLSTKQNAQCEQRIAEQQLTIESLQHSLATIEREVQTASGSADHLKRQVQDTSADLASHKLMLAIAERSLAQRSGELAEAREEISALQDSLAASGAARADLVELCSEYSAGAESRAAEFVRALTERVLLEREEMLTRLAVVCPLSLLL